MSICRLCGKDTKLCKAHIIPDSFYRAMKKRDNTQYFVILDGKHKYEETRPIGVWDNHILCAKCDNEVLGIYDNDAYTYLTSTNFSTYRKQLDDRFYYELELSNKDYTSLKLFFQSILYRASISKIEFSRNVNLGERYETIIKESILRKDSTRKEIEIIPLLLNKRKIDPKQTLSSFYKQRIDGVNGYGIILEGFKFWIKVDSQKTPDSLSLFQIHPGTILIPEETFEETADFRAAQQLAQRFKK